MRIVRFSGGDTIKYGIVKDNLIHSLAEDPFTFFESQTAPVFDGQTYPLNEVKLLAPCEPSKIVCLGVNYRPHAEEMNHVLPASPLIFLKPSTAVIGHDEPIILPHNWKRVDYECELGVVIGKKAKNVAEENAHQYILGYTCFNDVTERHLQQEDGQWTRAKGFDTFAPLGPWIETGIDPDDLKLETYLNGKVCQSARTSELIFGISRLVNFISGVMTLLPGDVIATGTPAGISSMKPGDVVEIRIEKIGVLRNPIAGPD
jgi:2-keto-4-pentenoate hydratase/2-oxohepta-3-ene-1,7-dioic acid hydratase in catechol pathway